MTKIAIIEDDLAISQMYRLKFETEHYKVKTADNGRDGIALVEDFLPDIILIDLQMPELTGDKALAEIRAHDWGHDIPVIVLTNMGHEEAPDSLKTLNVSSYIVKADLTPSQVVNRVKETLDA